MMGMGVEIFGGYFVSMHVRSMFCVPLVPTSGKVIEEPKRFQSSTHCQRLLLVLLDFPKSPKNMRMCFLTQEPSLGAL